MYRLSICANTIFLDLPFEERLKKIAQAGFLVEFWGWQEHNLDIFTGIKVCGFSGTQGGSCVHPDGLEDYVAELLQKYHPYIGHIHVADVPGRHEPGTGELNYRFIAKVLRDVGYEGVVGMEAFPLADSNEAMERFRAAFSNA